jgi:hypothetical protein
MNEPRRSFLGDLELPPAPQEYVQSIPSASASISDSPRRRGRKPAHKRKRTWEANHRPQTFVGVPAEVRDDIRNLADQYRREQGMVGGVDAVARELLRYSLMEYAEGRLDLHPGYIQGKSTLSSGVSWGMNPKIIPTSKVKQKKPKAPTATYRLPEEQVKALRAIILHEEHKAAPAVIHLTLGQVITRLLAHALQAYRENRWGLYTTPMMTIQGLKGEAA